MTLHIQPALMAKYHQAGEAMVAAEKALSLAEEAFSDTEAELLGELGTIIELPTDELNRELMLGQIFLNEIGCQDIFVLDQCGVGVRSGRIIGRLYYDGRIVMDGDEPDDDLLAVDSGRPMGCVNK